MPCAIFRRRDIAAGFDRRLPYGFTAAELKQRMNLLARCVHTSEEAKVTSENLAWLRQVCVVARRPVLFARMRGRICFVPCCALHANNDRSTHTSIWLGKQGPAYGFCRHVSYCTSVLCSALLHPLVASTAFLWY